MIPHKHFYMIRHGETEANAAEIMAGSLDSPLTKRGIEQARRARDVIAKLSNKPRVIVHSQLSRARDTAHIINEALDIPIYENPDWAEIHAGSLEGASYEVSRKLFVGWDVPEDGEQAPDFFERIKRAKIHSLTQYEGPVLIVCHGGVMRAIGEIHGIEPPGRFKNAQLYEFTPTQKETQPFPWQVQYYDWCDTQQKLITEKSELYT